MEMDEQRWRDAKAFMVVEGIPQRAGHWTGRYLIHLLRNSTGKMKPTRGNHLYGML
jgi:hypothetical protein